MSTWERGKGANGSALRIMIVDDEPDIRLLLHVVLGADGLDVVGEAADGAEALRMAHRNRPEVIILDQNMPVLTGEETAPALRRILPGVWIVACSASIDDKPIWADDFVPKEDIAHLAHRLHLPERVA